MLLSGSRGAVFMPITFCWLHQNITSRNRGG
nr:MAG TPA: hypothetical protein [Caudoviricetes sp.]